VSNLVILDTSIFIDHHPTRCRQQRIDSLAGLIRLSSVVLAQLWRGATEPAEREFLRALEENHRILTPTENDWLESGRLLGQIYSDKGFTPDKLRDLHFGALVALPHGLTAPDCLLPTAPILK
jgi:predicted nucleic acid-binding protein